MKRRLTYLIIFLLSVASLCLMQRGVLRFATVSAHSSELKTDSCLDNASGRLLFGEDFYFNAVPVGTAVVSVRNIPKTNPTTTLKNIFIKGGNTVNLSKPFDFIINRGHYDSGTFSEKTRFIILQRFQI